MISLLLDTALLAIPNYGVDANTAEEIIARTFKYYSIIAEGVPITVYQNETAQDFLWSSNCGPDFDNISQFLEVVGLSDVFQANDILRSYNTLLDRCPSITAVGVAADEYVLTNLNPNPIEGSTPVVLADESRRCVVSAACNVRAGRIIGLVPGWRDEGVHLISADYDVSAYLPPGATDPIGPHVQEVALAPRPFYIALHGWSARIWRHAGDALDIHLAIAVRAIELQLAAGKGEHQVQMPVFHVGPQFYASLQGWQAAAAQPFAQLVLDVCAQLVSGTCNRYQREMGAGQQIMRETDGAGAMRVHLTDSHEALRLMYWRKGNMIEFANVGPKFELVIRPGNPGLETKLDCKLIAA